MKGLLIDPFAKTVTEVDVKPKDGDVDIRDIHKHIGADHFDIAYLGNSESIFVDDEGLLKPVDQQAYFLVMDRFIDGVSVSAPLAGKGLFMGFSAYGDTLPAWCDAEQLASRVQWISREQMLAMSDRGLFNGTVTPLDREMNPIENQRVMVPFELDPGELPGRKRGR